MPRTRTFRRRPNCSTLGPVDRVAAIRRRAPGKIPTEACGAEVALPAPRDGDEHRRGRNHHRAGRREASQTAIIWAMPSLAVARKFGARSGNATTALAGPFGARLFSHSRATRNFMPEAGGFTRYYRAICPSFCLLWLDIASAQRDHNSQFGETRDPRSRSMIAVRIGRHVERGAVAGVAACPQAHKREREAPASAGGR